MAGDTVLEREIEKKATDWAKRNGWWSRKFTSPAHRSSPDRIFAKRGVVVFVEFKRAGQKPTPLQAHEHVVMRGFGLLVFVIDSVEGLKDLLSLYDSEGWPPAEALSDAAFRKLAATRMEYAQAIAQAEVALAEWDA